MRFLEVELLVPDLPDLGALLLCAAIGVAVGLGLLYVTHGRPGVVLAEATAAVTAGFLAKAGANAAAGWRGVALRLAEALCAYGPVLMLW